MLIHKKGSLVVIDKISLSDKILIRLTKIKLFFFWKKKSDESAMIGSLLPCFTFFESDF